MLGLIKLAPGAFSLSESSEHLSREVLGSTRELVRELEELSLIREMLEPIVKSLSPFTKVKIRVKHVLEVVVFMSSVWGLRSKYDLD